MRNRFIRAAFGVAVLAAVLNGCGSDQEGCLPRTIGEWSAPKEAKEYVGDSLFIYINGGAEIYHEYGFEKATVHHYERGRDCITIEVFTMTGDAFGIYTFSRSASGRPLPLGNGATAAEYYVHVWSGNCLAVVTADTDFSDKSIQVVEIAAVVAGCLPPGGSEPELMGRLPVDRQIEGSSTFIKGPIALGNAARTVAPLFAGYLDGAMARYDTPDDSEERVVLLRWRDENGAAAALDEAEGRASVINSTAVRRKGDRLTLEIKGEVVEARREAELITVTIDGA